MAAGSASETVGSLVREFFIDFLGSLLPGMWFTLLATPLAMLSTFLFWEALTQPSQHGNFELMLTAARDFRIELVLAFLVFSYVFGGVFFRQDPKEPDQESAAYILHKTKKADLARSVIQPSEEEYAALPSEGLSAKQASELAKGEGGQFPYSHLKKYLNERGLWHLAEMVPWDWSKPGQHGFRTKMFINVLKMQLQQLAPDKCAEVVRNEAHIRMMSSLWYAASGLWRLSLVSAIAVLFPVAMAIVMYLLEARNPFMLLPETCGVLVLAGISFVFAAWLQSRIRRFFHYQRVREIVYVLETFHIATERHPELRAKVQELTAPQAQAQGAS